MDTLEVIETTNRVVTYASTLPQTAISLNTSDEISSAFSNYAAELQELNQCLVEGAIDTSQCPECDGKIITKNKRKYLFFKQLSYSCEKCTYTTDNFEELESRARAKWVSNKANVSLRITSAATGLLSEITKAIETQDSTVLCCETDSLILSIEEKVVLAIPAVIYAESNTRHSFSQQTSNPNRTYIGGSLRIAKGFSINLGQSFAQPRQSISTSVSINSIAPKDQGTLYLTTRRAIFIGESKASTSIDLAKLVSASLATTPDDEKVIMLQASNRQKPAIIGLQDVAFQPGGIPWPLFNQFIGIKVESVIARLRQLASNV